jgi:hypothetical protein
MLKVVWRRVVQLIPANMWKGADLLPIQAT